MGVLQVDPIATLEQIRNPLSKIPFKISRITRIIAYIERAVADILAQDLQNAAEKIRLIEYELKTTKPMYFTPIQPYLLDYCQVLRRAFREYYGIYIPQRVNPFRLMSRP
ncbi:MAG TPA: hypothetical protein VEC37_04475, partial [Bacillota bacterium]|nr:hypothetical protein [Bacillota bacterium]